MFPTSRYSFKLLLAEPNIKHPIFLIVKKAFWVIHEVRFPEITSLIALSLINSNSI